MFEWKVFPEEFVEIAGDGPCLVPLFPVLPSRVCLILLLGIADGSRTIFHFLEDYYYVFQYRFFYKKP